MPAPRTVARRPDGPHHREGPRMDRRRFLQNLAATAAAANTLGPAVAGAQPAEATRAGAQPATAPPAGAQQAGTRRTGAPARASRTRGPVNVEGHTVVSTFTAGAAKARVTWTVYEDL